MNRTLEGITIALNQTVNELQVMFENDFKTGNQLLDMRVSLSLETGLNQKEIGELNILKFFKLVRYHDVRTREELH
jgi:hypothetical protein